MSLPCRAGPQREDATPKPRVALLSPNSAQSVVRAMITYEQIQQWYQAIPHLVRLLAVPGCSCDCRTGRPRGISGALTVAVNATLTAFLICAEPRYSSLLHMLPLSARTYSPRHQLTSARCSERRFEHRPEVTAMSVQMSQPQSVSGPTLDPVPPSSVGRARSLLSVPPQPASL